MKIIKNGQEQNIFPIQVTCEYCDSVLEIDKSDTFSGEYGSCTYTCPVCKRKNYLDNVTMPDLTVDTLQYPQNFCHYSIKTGAVDLDDAEIEKYIKEGIKYLRENPKASYWFIQTGCIYISIFRFSDEFEYEINITKDFFQVDLSFTDEDYTDDCIEKDEGNEDY